MSEVELTERQRTLMRLIKAEQMVKDTGRIDKDELLAYDLELSAFVANRDGRIHRQRLAWITAIGAAATVVLLVYRVLPFLTER